MAGVSSSTGHNKLMILFQNQSVEPHNLQLKELKEITNDLSDERLLGQGGFGKVYKGVLPNGDMIAVKKLTWTMTGIQDKHYQNEARHLMRLKHPNIVQLVGYCSETEKELVLHNGKYVYAEKPERLICLQYVPKGSHCRHLSDESSGLDWDTRYKIIKGICCGLHYLHEEWQPGTPMIHRDLKPANILLNDNMVPKIADFGLSRIFGEEPTRTITKNLDGTLGYMAPEYLNRGIITKELDIFSLGVIIIEIMTGHKHYPYKDETSSQEFIELVVEKWRNRLKNTPGYTSREIDIRSCIEVALLCVKLDRAERPTIRQIIQKLAFGCDPKSMFGGGAAGRWIREAKIEAAKQETVAAAGKEASNEDEVKKKRKGKKPEGAGEAEPIAAVEKSLSVPPVDLSYNKLPQPSASVSYFGHAPQPLPQPAYSVQQPQPQHWSPSYMYMPSPQTAPETYYQDSWLQPIPRDSYRIFDEENPNACSIM